MNDSNHEFRHVSRKQRIQLFVSRAIVMFWILGWLAMVALQDTRDAGWLLLQSSAILNGIFAYVNLMAVKVEVAELFEQPLE